MINKCGYKQENYCNGYKKTIKEVEQERQVNCCDTCDQAVETYSDKDKVRLLYEGFKHADKEKSAYEVMYTRAMYGHSGQLENDFDDLYYRAYTIWLVIHKKYKYIDHWDILQAYECMQIMGMRIPKRIRREARRIKRNCEKYEDYTLWN